MDTQNQFQILAKAVCTSHSVNTLEKGVNPTILLPRIVNSMADWVLWPLYGNQSRRRKDCEFKPVKLCLKIEVVLNNACDGGVG